MFGINHPDLSLKITSRCEIREPKLITKKRGQNISTRPRGPQALVKKCDYKWDQFNDQRPSDGRKRNGLRRRRFKANLELPLKIARKNFIVRVKSTGVSHPIRSQSSLAPSKTSPFTPVLSFKSPLPRDPLRIPPGEEPRAFRPSSSGQSSLALLNPPPFAASRLLLPVLGSPPRVRVR